MRTVRRLLARIEAAQQRLGFARRQAITRAHHGVTRDLGEHALEALFLARRAIVDPARQELAVHLVDSLGSHARADA